MAHTLVDLPPDEESAVDRREFPVRLALFSLSPGSRRNPWPYRGERESSRFSANFRAGSASRALQNLARSRAPANIVRSETRSDRDFTTTSSSSSSASPSESAQFGRTIDLGDEPTCVVASVCVCVRLSVSASAATSRADGTASGEVVTTICNETK